VPAHPQLVIAQFLKHLLLFVARKLHEVGQIIVALDCAPIGSVGTSCSCVLSCTILSRDPIWADDLGGAKREIQVLPARQPIQLSLLKNCP